MAKYRKNMMPEPGYYYANERREYLALTPEQRQKAKAVLEQIWQGKGCNAVRKNMVPCPKVKFERID